MKTSYGHLIKHTLIAFPRDAAEIQIPNNPFETILVLSFQSLSLGQSFKVSEGHTGIISCEGNFIQKFPERVARYIKQTIRENLDVRRFDTIPKDVYSLYVAFSKEKGFPAKSESELKDCMAFSAYEDGKPISAMFVLPSEPLLLLGIFSDGKRPKEEKRVMYEVCQWGHEQGYGAVDVNKLSKDEGLPNEVFKRSFGTVVVPRYRYSYRPSIFYFLEHFRFLLRTIKLLRHLKI